MTDRPRIDALQYADWSEAVLDEMRAGGLDAVHATIAYHGGFREGVLALEAWHRRFADHPGRLLFARTAADIAAARDSGRIAVFLGAQNPSILEDDLGLVEVWRDLGLRFLQITYNAQSLLGSGHAEADDTGLTLMGREVVAEMNRTGIAIDLSHAGERTALDAIAASARPVAVTHANPRDWCPTDRNVSDAVIAALAETGGMLGVSLYPHHLAGGSDCTLDAFCRMVADVAGRHGTEMLGIGSDLCRGRPDEAVHWMRHGRWRRPATHDPPARFPDQPAWFRSSRDFPTIAAGLAATGFSGDEVAGIMGGNWARFIAVQFGGKP